ncbi:CheR family methyltransferase [Alteromonas lipolytica]|uniref:Chemotaxis protein methyltransferase n=1 Tax=Alteromonas lipolytica TaxID=1856405 RepID=A0A1E8F9R9_9ALTE|nr:CheR family methyltransferase [Alteromonas lipolytica]OFI32660.1 chemotaxis protein CheR [Alteromonas lipolytica]GGF74284.1 chemotaxis protein methyltransferase [Alteromonas lipolytica]
MGAVAIQNEREFVFKRADFDKVRASLMQKAGIRLTEAKDGLVYSRLAKRIRALGLSSFAEYLDYVESSKAEQEQFINALTTNLTSFFREPHHFDALADYLQAHPQTTTIWCAASSTGEEPYSIAMVVAEAFGSFRTPVKIIASDIDSNVLATAREGVYPLKSIERISHVRRQQFFHRGRGANSDKVRVVKELRDMVQFRQLNLHQADWGFNQPVDIVFCRNVMIYFDKETQLKVLARMVRLLKPDGLYVAGHSENFNHQSHLVTPIGKTLYRPVKAANGE